MQPDMDLDPRMSILQQRLGHSLRGGPARRRSPALDILTGQNPDHRVAPGNTLLVLRSSNPVPRVRFERPVPARRSRRSARVLAAAASAALLVGFVVVRAWPAAVEETPSVSDVVPAPAPLTVPTPSLPVAPAPPAEAAPVVEAPAAMAAPTVVVPAPASELRVLLDERFTTNTRQWPSDPSGTAWIANQSYRLHATRAAHFVAVGIPATDTLGDAIVSASFHKLSGPSGGGYGLIVRDQGPGPRDGQNQQGHFYVFEVGDRGDLGVWLRDGDHWVDLLTWTPSEAVRPGMATNDLTVTAIGDQLSFLVNGIPVANEVDHLLHTGAAGVFTGGDGNEVAVDRLTVRVPR